MCLPPPPLTATTVLSDGIGPYLSVQALNPPSFRSISMAKISQSFPVQIAMETGNPSSLFGSILSVRSTARYAYDFVSQFSEAITLDL